MYRGYEITKTESKQKHKKRSFFNRPKLRETTRFDKFLRLAIILGFLISIYTIFIRIEYKWHMVDGSIAARIISQFFRWDQLSSSQALNMVKSLGNTMALAFLSTLAGIILGLPMALLASRNITNARLAGLIKAVAGLMRAVPTIVWVLIFVSGYGLTSTTAVVGMFFHTLSFFIRSLSETFEEVDEATIEALIATGSSKFEIITGAIIPSTVTRIISWFAMRTEQNFATAVIIGPAVGVPGTIGTMINNASRIGDIPTLGFGVMLIFVTAFVMETIMNRLRKSQALD